MIWVKITAAVLAVVLATIDTGRGLKVGDLRPDRLLLILLLVAIAAM